MFRSQTSRFIASICTLSLAAMILAGCGGEGKALGIQPIPEPSRHDYSGAGYQSPNYHPYQTPSRVIPTGENRTHIGADYEPREQLQKITGGLRGGFTWYMGPSRDGVGVNRLINYDKDLTTRNGTTSALLSNDGFYPFKVQPRMRFGRGLSGGTVARIALFDARLLLNEILPPEFQIVDGGPYTGGAVNEGDIVVGAFPANEVTETCGTGAAACATNYFTTSNGATYTHRAFLTLPDDFTLADLQRATSIITHELLHALGIQGHVDSIEFPDSLMGTSGEFFPSVGFVIRPIDREALQIIYMSQHTQQFPLARSSFLPRPIRRP